jgi:hypothetical protein
MTKKYRLDRFFDFSNYDKDHPFYSVKNKKKLGFLKDECSAKPILEFIGLKAKLYSILLYDENKKRAKGCQIAVVNKFLTHDHYKQCLDNTIFYVENRRLQGKNQTISTLKLTKQIFTPFCDKRMIDDDGISSKPFGYKNNNC